MYSKSIFRSIISNAPYRKGYGSIFKASVSVKKNMLLFLLIFGICFVAFSQNSTVTGVIIEKESASKIVGAIVAIDGTAFVESTDVNGQFTFNGAIPKSEYVVSVSKEGYEERYFLINVIQEKKLVVDDVELEVTKKEKKRRKKLKKSSQKEGEKQDKRLAKEKKKLKKDKKGLLGFLKKDKEVVEIVYEDIPEEIDEEEEEEIEQVITPLQKKYAKILGIEPEEITNMELYAFIDEWMGSPYLMGGDSMEGIDCSSFSQRLYLAVYNVLIERTAQNQMDSQATDTFGDTQYLKEGDLLFFRAARDIGDTITHVGIYLANNKFIHATSRHGKSGSSGVKISKLPDWIELFYSCGRRVIIKS